MVAGEVGRRVGWLVGGMMGFGDAQAGTYLM